MFASTVMMISPIPSAPPVAARPPCISVANPQAGDFVAPQVAQAVADVFNADNILYLTDEDPKKRIDDIVSRLHELRRRHDGPYQLMAYGGDGTFQDVVQALMLSLFPRLEDLMTLPVQQISDRMLKSGIRLGLVRQGTENDVGWLSGSPISEIGAVLTYCDEALLTPLNLGMIQYLDDHGDPLPDVAPAIFPHNTSAGTVIAKTFQETSELRGRKSRYKRWWTGLKLGLKREPFLVQWHDSRHGSGSLMTPEVFVHATPLAGGGMGFPGVPSSGLAIKIFPDISLTRTVRLGAELAHLGRALRKGDLDATASEALYRNMDEDRQLQLQQGEQMSFQFLTSDQKPHGLPIQLCGDFVCEAYGMKVRALPPFPLHMSMPESYFHRMS